MSKLLFRLTAALKMAVQSALALASGVLVGVTLCVAIEAQPYPFFEFHLEPGGLFHSINDIVDVTIFEASWIGLVIAILSIPFWWLLGRLRFHSALASALLGFLMTGGICFFELGGGLINATVFGVVGAVSGLVVWRVGLYLKPPAPAPMLL